MTGTRVLKPIDPADAVRLMREAEGNACYVAGGTALQLDWAKGMPRPTTLIDLMALPGWSGCAVEAGRLRLGAGLRLSALEIDPDLGAALPLLTAAVRDVAAPGVRHRATLGGNIAGRTGCLLPALLALEAEVEIFDAEGSRIKSLEQWLRRPGDPCALLAAVLISPQTEDTVWVHRKVGLRAGFTPSVIGVAGVLQLDRSRVRYATLAVGGGINQPRRLPEAEALLVGQDRDAVDGSCLRREIAALIAAPSDTYRSGRYRDRAAAATIVQGLFPARTAAQPHSHISEGRPVSPLPCGEGLGVRVGERRSSTAAMPPGQPLQPSPPAPLHKGEGRRPRPLAMGESSGTAARARPRPRPQPGATPEEVRVERPTLPDRWRIRPDIADKVHGRLAYLTDHRRPDMLVGRILRAGRPHALIRGIDTRAAEALPGVAAVVTAADVPGLNGFGIMRQDQPALCHDRVRFVGDAVAAVAACDADTAARALALIAVDYEPLPTVDDPATALAPDAPPLHPDGNLVCEFHFAKDDVAAGFAASAHIVEETYVTPRQMHGFMETEGGYVMPEQDGTLTVCVGGQHGGRDRMQLARILDRPEDTIRVVTSPIGGGFGGKDELTVQPALALLALKCGRPVRLHLDRAESVASGMKSNPMRIHMRTGCDSEGRILAQEVDLLVDCGAYASLSPAVLETALEHVCGPYVVPHVRTHGRLAYTNNGRCGAFRGFGANQMTFAIESQIGRLAERLGLDPVEIRRRNLRVPGSPGYFGHAVGPSERLREMLDAAAASPLWHVPDPGDPNLRIGIGMAINHQGTGLGSVVPDDGAVRLRLLPNGGIEAAYGLDEMGQGLLTAIKEVVATILGCGRDDVRPRTGDTALTPDSGSTSAARGTYVIWQGAQQAGPGFAATLRAAAGARLGRDPDELALAPGGLRDARSNSGDLLLSFADLALCLDPVDLPVSEARYSFPVAAYTAGNSRYLFTFGAALARVAVDRASGTVSVTDLHQHTAAGPMIEPAAYLGQIEGGNLQGLGFTLTEHAAMAEGRFVTANLDGYMLPGIADAPARTAVFALEDLDPGDPYGPRGVGEIGIGAIAPAICAAIADATGVWPARMPVDPEALLDAMDGVS